MNYNYIIYTKENGIATITFHRPEAMNALCSQLLTELSAAVEEAATDKEVRVVVFTGEGKSFIAGADISEMESMDTMGIIEYSRKGAALLRRIETMPKPTIAAVNGYAFGGGCEFVLCTDIRIAHEKASFAMPEVTLGIVPGFNGTQRLPKCIGASRAKELMFTGRRIKADEAFALGLVNKVVPADSFNDEVKAEAELIAKNSACAISLLKAALVAGEDVGVDVGKDIELGYMTASFGTADQIEGFKAFKEKRPAKFN
jgi:enoyl-CoA hydratase